MFPAEGAGGTGIKALDQRDPRLKLLLLLLLVMTIFSATDLAALVLVGVPILALLLWQPQLVKPLALRLWYLRWLLLFTLLLHLFFTPGRTLFGLRILSYDGLLRGLMVDLQLLLALGFTQLLALSTQVDAIAWAAVRLLRPLEKIGLRVSKAGGMLALVLRFLPRVVAEGRNLRTGDPKARSLTQRFEGLAHNLGDMILRLVNFADQVAREQVEKGEEAFTGFQPPRWSRLDSLCLAGGIVFVGLCWGV